VSLDAAIEGLAVRPLPCCPSWERLQTCRLQRQSVLRCLYEALVAHRDSLRFPSLISPG
jgi:hypothetical protein